MNIRDATPADLPAINAIYNHAVLGSTCTADYEPWNGAKRQAWYDERRQSRLPVLVAQSEGEVLGFAALSQFHVRPGYRFTVENSVYVAERARGRGVGRALLSELVARARADGYRAIIAGMDGENLASRTLHERLGFVEVGRLSRVVFKFERWLDVVYLQRWLDENVTA